MKNPLVPRVGNRSRRENPGPGKIKLKSDRLYTIEDDVNCRNTNMIVAVVTAVVNKPEKIFGFICNCLNCNYDDHIFI